MLRTSPGKFQKDSLLWLTAADHLRLYRLGGREGDPAATVSWRFEPAQIFLCTEKVSSWASRHVSLSVCIVTLAPVLGVDRKDSDSMGRLSAEIRVVMALVLLRESLGGSRVKSCIWSRKKLV